MFAWGWGTYRACICACEVSMESLGCPQYYSIKLWGTYWESVGEKDELLKVYKLSKTIEVKG